MRELKYCDEEVSIRLVPPYLSPQPFLRQKKQDSSKSNEFQVTGLTF